MGGPLMPLSIGVGVGLGMLDQHSRPAPAIVLVESPAALLPAAVTAGVALSPSSPARDGPNLAVAANLHQFDPNNPPGSYSYADGEDGWLEITGGAISGWNHDIIAIASAGLAVGDVVVVESLGPTDSLLRVRTADDTGTRRTIAQDLAPGTTVELTVETGELYVRVSVQAGATNRVSVRRKDAVPAVIGTDFDLKTLFSGENPPIGVTASGLPPGWALVDGVLPGASVVDAADAGTYQIAITATDALHNTLTVTHDVIVGTADVPGQMAPPTLTYGS